MNRKQRIAVAILVPVALALGVVAAVLCEAWANAEPSRPKPIVVHVVHHGSIREVIEE